MTFKDLYNLSPSGKPAYAVPCPRCGARFALYCVLLLPIHGSPRCHGSGQRPSRQALRAGKQAGRPS